MAQCHPTSLDLVAIFVENLSVFQRKLPPAVLSIELRDTSGNCRVHVTHPRYWGSSGSKQLTINPCRNNASLARRSWPSDAFSTAGTEIVRPRPQERLQRYKCDASLTAMQRAVAIVGLCSAIHELNVGAFLHTHHPSTGSP